jgi:DNA-binding NarL/FixJ family response regulator
MDVVLLATDLMVVSRVQGAATQAGAAIKVAASESQAVQLCREANAGLLIIDLATPMLSLESIRQMTADSSRVTKIVAFGPHVHEDRLNSAREAGCDLVVSRGRFFNDVDVILREGTV